jgi:hypothetical protein
MPKKSKWYKLSIMHSLKIQPFEIQRDGRYKAENEGLFSMIPERVSNTSIENHNKLAFFIFYFISIAKARFAFSIKQKTITFVMVFLLAENEELEPALFYFTKFYQN